MKNKITLDAIATAIKKNCVIDTLSPKPLTLHKGKGNKSKSLGRLLFICLAHSAGIDSVYVMNYLELTPESYVRGREKISLLLQRGKDLFEERSPDISDPALYFYRKLRIIESALGMKSI